MQRFTNWTSSFALKRGPVRRCSTAFGLHRPLQTWLQFGHARLGMETKQILFVSRFKKQSFNSATPAWAWRHRIAVSRTTKRDCRFNSATPAWAWRRNYAELVAKLLPLLQFGHARLGMETDASLNGKLIGSIALQFGHARLGMETL